jgi:hypothetical protein
LDCVEVLVNNTHEGPGNDPGQDGVSDDPVITLPLLIFGLAGLLAAVISFVIRRNIRLGKQ